MYFSRYNRRHGWGHALLLLVTLPMSTTAMAQSFGSCDSRLFLAQNQPTTLSLVNTNNNPLTFPALGTASINYNAIGFSPTDFYLYGMERDTNHLVRIAANGSTTDLGAVTGLPSGVNYTAGEIGTDGFFYVKSGTVGNTMYRINLSTRAATAIPLSIDIGNIPDFAWSGGFLYGRKFNSGDIPEQLYRINPVTGAVTAIGPTLNDNLAFGAMFGTPDGVFGASNNGDFYEFNLTTGAHTLISEAPASNNNDGAHCVTQSIRFGADLSITKTDDATTYLPGGAVVYTIVVRNSGPFGAAGNTVTDSLPTGITTASWTCGSATGGATCGVASGTGAINDTGLDLPVNSQVTYTLTLSLIHI